MSRTKQLLARVQSSRPTTVHLAEKYACQFSPYRACQAIEYLLMGFAGVEVVSAMPRGLAARPGFGEQTRTVVVIRGATSGRWGKSMMIRYRAV